MPAVSSISAGAAAGTTDPAAELAARIPQKKLGQQDFLKLLAVQYQAQDPMNPVADTAFIAQMAQFSALEQSATMAKEMSELRIEQERSAANSYLGHRVSVTAADGAIVSGDVTAIDRSGEAPLLVVGGASYSLSAVLRVEPAFGPAPAATPVISGGN